MPTSGSARGKMDDHDQSTKRRKIKAFHTMAVLEAFGVRSLCTTTSLQSSLFHTATEGMPSSSGKRPAKVEGVVDEETFQLQETPQVISRE